MNLEDFFCRDQANTKRYKIPLRKPSGAITKEWIEIQSELSDDFRTARDRAYQDAAIALASEPDEGKRKAIIEDRSNAARAALITGWSFKEEATLDRKKELLKHAPHISDMVNRLAADGALFFAESDSSTTGQETKSD